MARSHTPYPRLCDAMVQKGWLSHPLAAMKIGMPSPGKQLGLALRSTHTYEAFHSGQTPPRFDQQSATPATLTYTDTKGTHTDRILLDRRAGLVMHIHSETGQRKIAFLDDIPSAHIDEGTTSSAPPAVAQASDKPGASASASPTFTSRDDSDSSLVPLVEGAAVSVVITAYERNPLAREKCLRHYGTSCFVCGFSFSETYGRSVTGCIHVHHLKTVASRGGEYVVDPVDDLRPVCPNCHCVLHRKEPPWSIQEVKSMLERTLSGSHPKA